MLKKIIFILILTGPVAINPVYARVSKKIANNASNLDQKSQTLSREKANVGTPAEEPKAPDSFNINASELPENFIGVNPDLVRKWIEAQIKRIPTKIDQYSTDSEKEAYARELNAVTSSLGPLPFVVDVNRIYDPDQALFKFNLSVDPLELSSAPKGIDGDPNPRKIVVSSESRIGGTYIGQNAYGATRDVESYSDTEYSLTPSLRYGKGPLSLLEENSKYKWIWHQKSEREMYGRVMTSKQDYEKSQASIADYISKIPLDRYKFGVEMDSNIARTSDKDIRCVLVFSPTSVHRYHDYMAATYDHPVSISRSGYTFVGRLNELWVINRKTGEIYKKFR